MLKGIDELINCDDATQPTHRFLELGLQGWLAGSESPARVLPFAAAADGGRALLALQMATARHWEPRPAIAGGLLADHGWVRHRALPRGA